MKGKIYLLDDKDGLRAMNETPYESEKLLQELLAKHPDLLAGDQIDRSEPRRWLLVSREMAVAAEEDGASRWSLDHLFLDQDGVLTLVEVKRSTDTRVRQEVVGQMLDYAAHAVHWKIETLQAKFELTCSANGDHPEDLMSAFLDEGLDVDAFWQQVKTNLQAGLLRLVFVADVIPSELLDIIEFLNKQMDPAQAIAVEVRQFVGEDMRTLVPRVLGRTDPSRERVARSAGREPVGREVFWQAFADDRPADEHVVMRQLENWAIERGLERLPHRATGHSVLAQAHPQRKRVPSDRGRSQRHRHVAHTPTRLTHAIRGPQRPRTALRTPPTHPGTRGHQCGNQRIPENPAGQSGGRCGVRAVPISARLDAGGYSRRPAPLTHGG